MLYRRACEGMAGRPHGWGSRKVEWQGAQRSPNLIRIYNQCSWKALMCWIKPKEPTGTSVYAWLSVWFWQRMESLTRHSIWTPSPFPPILTRTCKIDPVIIFEARPLLEFQSWTSWPRRRRNALKRKLSDPSCLPRVEFLRRESMSEVLLRDLPMHARSSAPFTPNFNVVVFWWLAHEGTLHSTWSTLRFGEGWRRDQDSRLKNSTLCQDSIPTGCMSWIFCVCVCLDSSAVWGVATRFVKCKRKGS